MFRQVHAHAHCQLREASVELLRGFAIKKYMDGVNGKANAQPSHSPGESNSCLILQGQYLQDFIWFHMVSWKGIMGILFLSLVAFDTGPLS